MLYIAMQFHDVWPALPSCYDSRSYSQRPTCSARGPTNERFIVMKNSIQALALAAAVAGFMGGTSIRLNAQSTQANNVPTAQSTQAGVQLAQNQPNLPKHSCKGKNDCKGQGGGKHPGTNS